MDELQKTEARNYLIAGGLLLTGILFLAALLSGDVLYDAVSVSPLCAIGGFIILVIGIILLTLKKRDLAGISFIVLGLAHFMTIFNTPDSYMMLSIARAFALVWGIVLLFSADKQKWVFAPLTILYGLVMLLRPYGADIPAMGVVLTILFILSFVFPLYFALAAGFERISLPGRNLITADETTDFKKSGSAIGYTIFGTVALSFGLFYCSLPGYTFSVEALQVVSLGLGMLLILFGVLLFTIGKMRFTPVMFILIGTEEMISALCSGPVVYAIGVLLVVTGLFAMLRKESRILPGLMLIIYGASYFISVLMGGTAVAPVVSALLNIIPAAISLYLAVATLSQRKIPLF